MIHAVHVYQPGNIPPYTENTERARYVEYGDTIDLEFKDVFIHDGAEDQKQVDWLTNSLMPLMVKGGTPRYLPTPSPMSPRVSVR